MIIKLLCGNPRKSALVLFSKDELIRRELTADSLSLQSIRTRQFLAEIFSVTEKTCGFRRNGNFVTVECRPLKNGGCRFLLQYTEEPSGKLFQFREPDDLLDAVIQLQKNNKFNTSQLTITCSEGNNTIYIPPEANPDENNPAILAILSEYSL